MSGEGEFQKRIRAFEQNTFHLGALTGQQAVVVKNSMMGLIEEAKKDFPFKGKVTIDGDNIHFEGEDTRGLFLVSDWFVKWFGSQD